NNKKLLTKTDRLADLQRQTKGIGELKKIAAEPLVKAMYRVFFILLFIIFMQDFLFLKNLKSVYSDMSSENISGFLGTFRGFSNLATFIIQMTLAGFILKKLGTARSMFVLPIGFLMIFCLAFLQRLTGIGEFSVTNMFFYLLTVGMGMRIALFDSIFSPNFQVFFTSLPKSIRGRSKILLEGMVKPVTIAFVGFMIIFISRYGTELDGVILGILLFFSMCLVAVVFGLKREYARSITKYLGGDKLALVTSLSNVDFTSNQEGFITILHNALQDSDKDVQNFAISYLTKIGNDSSIAILMDEFHRRPMAEKHEMLEIMGECSNKAFYDFYKEVLAEDKPEVLGAVIIAIYRLNMSLSTEELLPYLYYPDIETKFKALVAVWNNSLEDRREKIFKYLTTVVSDLKPEELSIMFYAFGEIGDETFMPLIEGAVNLKSRYIYENKNVFNALVVTCGKLPGSASLNMLIRLSSHLEPRNEIYFVNSFKLHFIRSFDALLKCLKADNLSIKLISAKAVAKSSAIADENQRQAIYKIAMDELSNIYNNINIVCCFEKSKSDNRVFFLLKALYYEEKEIGKQILVKLMEILDKTGQIATVSGKLFQQDKHHMANALELLENLGNPKITKWLIPLFENPDNNAIRELGKNHFELSDLEVCGILRDIFNSGNKWLKSCAFYSAYQLYLEEKNNGLLNFLSLSGEQMVPENINKYYEEWVNG
ncbi:MAG: hypothetical protein ABIA63_04415, partial [bacterium]